jgi:GT2 family glycosyltransferase
MSLIARCRERLGRLWRGRRQREPPAAGGLSLGKALPWLESQSGFPRFPRPADPTVSIVVPAFGELPMTLRCLHAVARAGSTIAYEVILVDDASDPPLSDLLASTPGLRVLRTPANAGFVGAARLGAEEARGQCLLFLNNDTAVTPGWLDALYRRLMRPGVGMVGALLVSWNGAVQEAGGIVWRDGSATNYGRGEHPEAPAVGFARPVDYCSGACLLIRRDLYVEVGGFDPDYAPGYYEDVDLAFRVRRRGLRVEYEPLARVYHREGGTAGTDPRRGMKRFQEAHREVFVERWGAELNDQLPREFGSHLGRWHGARQACLVVDRHLPTPRRDAGSKRLLRMLEHLRELGWLVTFAAYDLADLELSRRALETHGIEVLRNPHVTSLPRYLRQHGAAFDCVFLGRLGVAERLLPEVKRYSPQARVVFDTVDLRSLREKRAGQLRGDAKAIKQADRTLQRELELVRQTDATLVTSPVERDFLLRHEAAATVAVAPTCYRSVRPELEFERRTGVLFIGGFRHEPNLDAVLWLLDEIWPRVTLLVPGLQLHIIGEEPPYELSRRAGGLVHIHGFVPDTSSYFERVRLSVAPLRFGAGLKGKVHEALARGLPCVATPVAAEGLGLMPDIHAVLAERASDFAEAIVRLHSDRDLWQRLSVEGRAHVERYFSDAVFRQGLATALGAARPGRRSG